MLSLNLNFIDFLRNQPGFKGNGVQEKFVIYSENESSMFSSGKLTFYATSMYDILLQLYVMLITQYDINILLNKYLYNDETTDEEDETKNYPETDDKRFETIIKLFSIDELWLHECGRIWAIRKTCSRCYIPDKCPHFR